MLFSYQGYMTADVVPFVEQVVARVLATGAHPDLFVDLGRLDGYDSDYRRSITRWGVRNRRHFGDYWFFVRSRLVAIGVAVSNLAAGGTLKATTKRAEFDAAIRAAVRRQMGRDWTRDYEPGAGQDGF
jgi:hypothetical protein